MKKVLIIVLGFFLRITSYLFPINERKIIIGSANGRGFRDNSKYFFQYLINVDNNFLTMWITQDKKLLKQMRDKGYNVLYNFSIRGIYNILTAKYYAFSVNRGDVLYFFYRKGKTPINLWHGMPIKKIVFDFNRKEELKKNKIRYWMWEFFAVGFKHKHTKFILATSDYFSEIMKSAFRNKNVYVTGQPRTDIFFKLNRETLLKKFNLTRAKYITYMPTHRNYGKGELNLIPFINNGKMESFFIEKNYKLLIKLHPNMLNHKNYDILENSLKRKEFVCNFSKKDIDPQELLFLTDFLITDYSSCFIDYMLLNRPFFFFHYDDYEKVDNEVYLNLSEDFRGTIARNEEELFNLVVHFSKNKWNLSSQLLLKYYTYNDSNSSQRVLEIIKEL